MDQSPNAIPNVGIPNLNVPMPSINIVEAVTHEVKEIGKQFKTSRICEKIKAYDGLPKEFKSWSRELDRAKLTLDLSDNEAKLLAFETSKDYVSDAIERHLKDLERTGKNESWEEFKLIFKKRFAEVTTPTHAMSILRATKQGREESVALYAEKLISLAKEAYVEVLPTLPEGSYSLVDQQIVTIFQEGLSDHMIRAKVIRGKPTNMARAIELATEEVMFRQMLGSRSSNSATGAYGGRVESPMEVDHLRKSKCYECNGMGHQARNCPNRRRRPARVEAIGQVNCWGCGSEGHFRRECPENRGFQNGGPSVRRPLLGQGRPPAGQGNQAAKRASSN